MRVAVHVTHEATKKIGGIGAVLNGICTAPAYGRFFDRTLLYGPLFRFDGRVPSDLGEGGEILFSSVEGFDAGGYGRLFEEIVRTYGVEIVYGKRRLFEEFDPKRESVVDVCLVGIERMNGAEIARFKYELWKTFGIQSDLYAHDGDYEQYVRIALPLLEVLDRLYGREPEFVHFAHEYMGVPSGLSVKLAGAPHRTVFIAHEVSTARFLVESHSGHDISFYNVMDRASGERSLEEIYGSQRSHPRNELVKRAVHLDRVLAVSDRVKREYLFLVPDAPREKVRTAYNGVSARKITLEEKRRSRERIRSYIRHLFEFDPDVILTHVTRLVISKGLWRDLALLYLLDEIFESKGLRGAYVLLSTSLTSGRPPEDIQRMEREYGWPVLHREGWPDLVGTEIDIARYLDLFNARSRAIKGVFLNQFGFDRKTCGTRVPEGTEFSDLRIASDAELGFSIYEPFGIAQIETVPFGGAAILSSSCGCVPLLERAFQDAAIRPYHVVDFIGAGNAMRDDELQALTQKGRDRIERALLAENVRHIFDVLPVDESRREDYLENAVRKSSVLSWDSVVENDLLPNLSTG